jgi:hypothetical protein
MESLRAVVIVAALGSLSCTRAEPPRPDPATAHAEPSVAASASAASAAPVDEADAVRIKAMVLESPKWNRATRTAFQKIADCRAIFEREDSTHRHGEKFHIYIKGDRDRMVAYQDGKPLGLGDGTVIVKRTFVPHALDGGVVVMGTSAEDEGTLTAFFVMEKAKGRNPNGGDWLYATTKPDGTVLRAGLLPDCMACHEKRREQGYLYGLDYRWGTPPRR